MVFTPPTEFQRLGESMPRRSADADLEAHGIVQHLAMTLYVGTLSFVIHLVFVWNSLNDSGPYPICPYIYTCHFYAPCNLTCWQTWYKQYKTLRHTHTHTALHKYTIGEQYTGTILLPNLDRKHVTLSTSFLVAKILLHYIIKHLMS